MEHIIEQLLHDFENGKMNRRQLVKSLAVAAAVAGPAAADDGKTFHAVAVNHISYQVADYAKTRDFYSGLLGMKVQADNGSQCWLQFGANAVLARTPRARSGRGGDQPARPAPQTPKVDHIAYTVEDWNREDVEAELKRRGYRLHQAEKGHFSPLKPMEYRPDTEDSFHILDPDGFDLQIAGKNMHA